MEITEAEIYRFKICSFIDLTAMQCSSQETLLFHPAAFCCCTWFLYKLLSGSHFHCWLFQKTLHPWLPGKSSCVAGVSTKIRPDDRRWWCGEVHHRCVVSELLFMVCWIWPLIHNLEDPGLDFKHETMKSVLNKHKCWAVCLWYVLHLV